MQNRVYQSIDQYRNDPKFSDRYAWANSVDPDQTAPSGLIRVCTVCHSVCIVWTHYSMVGPHSSNFRVIITNFSGVRILRKFTVVSMDINSYHTNSHKNFYHQGINNSSRNRKRASSKHTSRRSASVDKDFVNSFKSISLSCKNIPMLTP